MNILSKLTFPEHGLELIIYDRPSYNGTGILRRVYLPYNMMVNGEVLFSGSDFSPSPMDAIDSIDALICLLSFLTVRPGDMDDDHFKDYTLAQLDFANSNQCEDLQALPYDFEAGELDYYVIRSDDSLDYENFEVSYA